MSDVEVQDHYNNFFEEVFTELQEKYRETEEMNMCDNLGNHLVGNVYVKFQHKKDAEWTVAELNIRWFNGRLCMPSCLLSLTSGNHAVSSEMGDCTRGGF